jgi:hypothetical protein
MHRAKVAPEALTMRFRVVAAIGAGLVLVGFVALGGGVLSKVASGQSAGTFCCDPTKSGPCAPGSCPSGSTLQTVKFPAAGYSLSVQTTEPATGFTGACLVPQLTYTPQLPTVCFVPGGFFPYGPPDANVIYGNGSTSVTLPAAFVARPYSTLPAGYDSYQTLVTCFPNSPPACPQPSFAVSNSCCDMGTQMVSLDGKNASGLVSIRQ